MRREKRMRRSRMRRKVVAVAILGCVLGASAIAGATWLSSGTGSGNARATFGTAPTIAPITLTGAAPTGTALVPGGTADLGAQVSNPNPFPVWITDTNFGGPFVVVSGSAACIPDVGMSHAVTHVLVPAGVSHVIIPGAITLAATADTACQSAVYDLGVAVTTVNA